MHWVFANKGESTNATLVVNGVVYYAGEPLNANVWHFYTPFYNLTGLTATIYLNGEPEKPARLVISDYCPGDGNGNISEILTVLKTVNTSYNLTHSWSINKSVDTDNGHEHNGFPKIWLFADGSGNENATWTVNVNYTGSDESDHMIWGEITIINGGNVAANITSVVDELAGTPIFIDCNVTFPYTLPAGESLTCTYSNSTYATGFNNATVTTFNETREVQNLTYTSLPEPITWGDPDNEFFKTINVSDLSDLFGEVALGNVTAPNNMTFTYDKEFAWDDYGKDSCGDFVYNNTATIVETGQSADATLKVNVQPLITVEKTVDTSYNRTHNWSIDKSVDTEKGYEHEGFPKIWLFADGSGDENATWNVNVTYEGYQDSGHKVSGTITIINDNNVSVEITSAVDELNNSSPINVSWDIDGTPVTIPCTLPAYKNLTGTYSENGYVEGYNNVTVTTFYGWDEFNSTATDSAEIVWGDPNNEFFETINVSDLSELFDEVALGNVTAPANATFTYDKFFAWANYTCGDHSFNNTATIVETNQSADATLKVNVQCYDYETAFAKLDNEKAICFLDEGFDRWGWTNNITPGNYTMELWAAAGQCDTSKGTLVGNVTVIYTPGSVNVTYNVTPGYLLEETHVYAGTSMFPQVKVGKKTVDTIAPGQYYISIPSGYDGELYVIAHAVVGIPDPTFGP
ncbi:hypothetical protein [Methanolobus chelungpuianus]|nr:hypothetical protein [Methanolobus chelungpuianus]